MSISWSNAAANNHISLNEISDYNNMRHSTAQQIEMIQQK